MDNAARPTWKEIAVAYLRVTGVILPTRYVWRPFGGLLELDRCRADGRLVGKSQAALSRHNGHSMSNPVVLSFFEVFLVWIRVIR